jgi:phage-related protein
MNPNSFDFDFDLSEYFDASILLNIDLGKAHEQNALLTITPVLKLEELDIIDWEAVASSSLGITDPVGQLREWLAGVFSGFVDTLKKAFETIAKPITDVANMIWGVVSRIPDALRTLGDMLKGIVVDPLLSALRWVGENFPKVLDMFKDLGARVAEFITKLPSYVADFASKVGAFFADLTEKIKGGFAWFIDQVAKFPDVVRGFFEKAGAFFTDLANKIQGGFKWFIDQVAKLPDVIRDLVAKVGGFFADLTEKIKSGFLWFVEQVGKIPEFLRGLFEQAGKVVGDFVGKIQEGFKWFIDRVVEFPTIVRNVLEKVIGDITTGVGGFVEWVRKGFEKVGEAFSSFAEGAKQWFGEATKRLQDLGAVFQGFVNALATLPERLGQAFEGVVKFFEGIGKAFMDFITNAGEFLRKYVAEPLWNALVGLGNMIWEGLKNFWSIIVGGLTWIGNQIVAGFNALKDAFIEFGKLVISGFWKISEGIGDWFKKLLSPWFKSSSPELFIFMEKWAPAVEDVFESTIKETRGLAENLWVFGGRMIGPFWWSLISIYALRAIVSLFSEFIIKIDPEILGSKLIGADIKTSLRELVDALTRPAEVFASSYMIGMSMALANMYTTNMQQLYVPRVIAYYDGVDEKTRKKRIELLLGDLFAEELSKKASLDMFLKPVSESALLDYARRMLALSEGFKDKEKFEQTISTVRTYLRIYGLPAWYVDFLTKDFEKRVVPFMDRFGADRKILLSHIFELPTHSELARMTQRDIFPGVDVMKRIGWVRGWNEDLTTMIYLLTFKYPSFEKLWTFYMRALSGMLWFKAPETIKSIFDKEAEEVKAGKPVSPLDIQKALAGPDQVKAFETALNVYFKWLEYSNFSWFTDKTSMYGINVGAEVVGKLGGWTSDSWLMIDVSADIPTKIDMRWMSRFGIFLTMAEKFEKLGIKFESYAPMVEVTPKLMETSPASQVQVDLTWFSKLLQATGLHPAWVPITTVAENIMVIADEMTLLRTGWLNLFKEGMITVEDAEKSLAGLIVASYRVGYWNPEAKTWTSGWINLPVRWLPHERRLLELRMAMDRVLDIYREIYNYIRSGIRTLSITVDEAKAKLQELIKALSGHYKALTKSIVGQEMELKLDEGYATMWLTLQALAQDIEAKERIRVWWSRVSGWLLYRVAYGWVTDVEVEGLIDTIKKYIPLPKVEEEAYKEIAKAVLGIVRREAIPSPSQLATFAEYMVLPETIIAKVLKEHNVPEEYWPLWITYIAVKPIKSDYKAVITTALRALRYNAITYDQWKAILENATRLGFTPTEVDLLQLRADLELAIENAREYVPTPSQLAMLAEYIPEVRDYIAQVFEARRVKGVWAEMWAKYIYLRPTIDEVRRWANAMLDLAEYFIVDVSQLEQVFKILKTYGYEDLEITIIQKTIDVTRVRRAFLDVLGAPRTIVGMARYAEKATDIAVSRAFKMIDALPVDDNTKKLLKEMWTQYVMSYQAYPEIRSYETELINAYAYGALDDKGLDQELDYLRKLGVPELRLALVKRTAQLRRARRALTAS